MRVKTFMFAQKVTRSANGYYDLEGAAFDTFLAARFPTRLNLTMFCQIELAPDDLDQEHRYRFEFVNADGQLVAHIEQASSLASIPHDRERTLDFRFTMPMGQGVAIPAPEDFAFHVYVDGSHLRAYPFYVRLMAAYGG